MRILVVDDDETILELLTMTLASKGYGDITTAMSGQEALDAIGEASRPFDCFMLDIQMPGMDGIETCARIREMLLYRKTPVLMITAMSQKVYMERAFEAGATDYVTKPFDVIELLSRVSVAERLSQEIKQAEELRRNLDAQGALSLRQQKLRFDDPVDIDEADRVIPFLAMQNYLYRVPKIQSLRMGAFGVEIPELWQIFGGLSGRDYYCFLSDLADIMGKTLRSAIEFASHAGGGSFVCVNEAQKIPDLAELEAALEFAFEQEGLVLDDEGASLRLTPHFGRVFTPSLFGARAPHQFLTKAVDDAARVSRERRLGPSFMGSRIQMAG